MLSQSRTVGVAAAQLTQFVLFHTHVPRARFTALWQPTAAGFLASGLSTITLAEVAHDSAGGIAFVSRNTWPAAAYERVFPGGRAADGAGGPVTVRQGGVYSVHPDGGMPIATARPDLDLSLALLQTADLDEAGTAIADVLAGAPGEPSRHVVAYRAEHRSQRYQVAITVHGPVGSGPDSTSALMAATSACPTVIGGIFLTGRELFALPS